MRVKIQKVSRKFLELKQVENVIIAQLNNPSTHNAFNGQMIKELIHFFSMDFNSIGIRCVVLRGKGSSFCAGADINYMKSMKDAREDKNFSEALAMSDLYSTIAQANVVTIGVAHGYVYAGGIGILAACDIILSHDDAEFCFTEVKRGLIPATMLHVVIPRIGYSNARRYFLTGEVFSAQTAHRMNLIQEISPQSQIELKLKKIIEEIRLSAPLAQIAIKKMLNCQYSISEDFKNPHLLTVNEQKKYLSSIAAKLRVSEEGQEGMKSFFEKRLPNWYYIK